MRQYQGEGYIKKRPETQWSYKKEKYICLFIGKSMDTKYHYGEKKDAGEHQVKHQESDIE